jgi:hypothetical protein
MLHQERQQRQIESTMCKDTLGIAARILLLLLLLRLGCAARGLALLYGSV